MAFRGGMHATSRNKSSFGNVPANYVPGLGRGATGFTTRSDVGPVIPSSDGGGGATNDLPATTSSSGVGSRSAQAHQQVTAAAPSNYVAGIGRGATRLSKGDDDENATAGFGQFDAFGGYMERRPTEEGQFDEDDDEADRIWDAIDARMESKRKRKANDDDDAPSALKEIGAKFRELKEQLAAVSEAEWANIPDIGDYSLKYKQQKRRQQDTITPLTDSLLQHQKDRNQEASATLAGNATVNDGGTSTINISGLSAARGTVLGMSLDKMMTMGDAASSSKAASRNSVDAEGYLTSLSTTTQSTMPTAEIGDIQKARLLLKSVRDTNPLHGPGWIASARVEEAAGKHLQARKIIQEGCQICGDTSEDVWLEAARLHPVPVAKSILAAAVRKLPHSIKIFLKAADLEHDVASKKAVLRKALEANPTSATLWKTAIDLEENVDDARILLAVAVEKIPQNVDLWLALARTESYENAQKVLNKARKALPTDRSIWIAAAKLEESQNHHDVVEKIIQKAVQSLAKHEAVVTRAQWLQEAENAEAAESPKTSAAIIKHTIGQNVDDEDRHRTWSEDAKGCVQHGSIATARAILEHALNIFPTKRKLWMQAVDLEKSHGDFQTLDETLEKASQSLPRVEIFWLLRAKERWLAGDVDKAREILTAAFAANPDSEEVWLAAAKLEWENAEIERARVLLQRARERAPTDRVYMKSALLEREQQNFGEALQLIEEGISRYPDFPKLYMMGGQICSENLSKQKSSLERARKFFERGLRQCPKNSVLWILASRLEEQAAVFDPDQSLKSGATKARSLLELARLQSPKNPDLWLEAVRLERRTGNLKLAETLMAKALQECPASGALLAENILTSPRVEQKSKSADAIKRCPDDPRVIVAVASLFASERKNDKARKWFDRAVIINPDLGDSWARYYCFELEAGDQERQEKVKERCKQADPKHGEIWTSVMKNMANRYKSIVEGLEIAAERILAQKN
jgi:pre-mRNA-processing factor 6